MNVQTEPVVANRSSGPTSCFVPAASSGAWDPAHTPIYNNADKGRHVTVLINTVPGNDPTVYILYVQARRSITFNAAHGYALVDETD